MNSPKDYGLKHEFWRPHQLETVQWVANVSPYVAKIAEQSTGSGKSTVAVAQSVSGQVLVMTKTKSLQRQYEDEIETIALYGANNYPCLHMRAAINATAEDCLYRYKLNGCDLYSHGKCEYYNVRAMASVSQRVALNYALWFAIADRILRPFKYDAQTPLFSPDYLVMDEAHTISDLVLDHVGVEFTEKQREKWLLPEFPIIRRKSAFIGFRTENTSRVDEAEKWISSSLDIIDDKIKKLELYKVLDEKKLIQLRQLRKMQFKFQRVKESLLERPGEHWFIRSGPIGVNGLPGLICRPITARYDAPLLFEHKKCLYMSATIGKVEAFTEELGIKNYESRVVPSQFSSQQRPVRILPVGSMGKVATEKDELAFEKQANVIAAAILDCPDEWSGFILVTRKAEAKLLADRLARRGLQDRVWVTPGYDGEYSPTNEQLNAWNKRLIEVSNSICITWAFWEGIDGVKEKICIVAKAPYIMETEYEQARREYDHKYYLQRAAYILEQGLGRTRRGNMEDYDDPETGEVNGLVAIADGSWTKLRSYLSQSLREAIVEQ